MKNPTLRNLQIMRPGDQFACRLLRSVHVQETLLLNQSMIKVCFSMQFLSLQLENNLKV